MKKIVMLFPLAFICLAVLLLPPKKAL